MVNSKLETELLSVINLKLINKCFIIYLYKLDLWKLHGHVQLRLFVTSSLSMYLLILSFIPQDHDFSKWYL